MEKKTNGDPAMIRKFLAATFGATATLAGCTGIPQGLQLVTDFDPDRYLGKWGFNTAERIRVDHHPPDP